MLLAAVLFTTCSLSTMTESVMAAKKQYRGKEKIESYNAYGEFTEGGIKYYVSEASYSGRNGEVYAAGGDFAAETLSIPATVKHNGRQYNVVGINDMAFENYENLIKVTIGDGVTYIGGGAFWGCWYLESITLPKNLKELGEYAFGYCGSLKSIKFPDSLTVIPNNVCEYSAVSKVTFGSKVTEIKSYAFMNCLGLKEITLPASLKTLEGYAFYNCYNLGKITNNSKLKKTDLESAFEYTKWSKDSQKRENTYTYADKDQLISIWLDNKQITDGYLYYRMKDYEAENRGYTYEDWEHGVYAELKKDSKGSFILDRKYVTDSMNAVQGEFYYCGKKPKDYLKEYTFKFGTEEIPGASVLGRESYDEDSAEAERIKAEQGEDACREFENNRKTLSEYTEEYKYSARPVRLYTISYEQGEQDCMFMPKDAIAGRYGYAKIGDGIDEFKSGIGKITHPLAPGRAFAYYADSTGKRIDSVTDITGPVTLHPVFVNEDELYSGNDYLSEKDYYYAYMYVDWKTIAENIRIGSGYDFVERLLTYTDKKKGMCIVDKKITFSCSDLEKYAAKNGTEGTPGYSFSTDGYFYNRDEIILIKPGGTLEIDGITLQYGVKISVQKGGKLILKNGAKINGGLLGVQEGGEVELDNGIFDGVLLNAGTITVKTPKYKRATDSFYTKSIETRLFLNSSSGVINLDYGALNWNNDFDMDYGPGMVRSDMRDEKDAVVINNGTVNVTGFGYISMYDGANEEHKEAYSKTSVVNNGTINITSSAERFYSYEAFELSSNIFYNYGTIKVRSDVRRTYCLPDSYIGGIGTTEFGPCADMELRGSVFINYGTLDLDIKDGAGLNISGQFFPYEKAVKRFEEDGYTASHGRLENRKGGRIKITSDNACGIIIGFDSYLVNDGTITIKEKDANSREPSLIIGGKVINNSKITNDGSIGYTTGFMYGEQKAYALDSGYSGKKWTGKGRELLAYVLDPRGVESNKEYNTYVTYDKTVLVDGSAYKGASNFATVFLPVNKKVKLNVKVSGFTDKTMEFTTAASSKDYVNSAYKSIKAGTDPTKYISISLTKGKSTADSSVTKQPLDIDKGIFLGNMEYSVTTSDLKGGTVCFERGGSEGSTLVVPDTITYEGRKYKVTMFNVGGTSETTSITIGKNVEYIDDEAFYRNTGLKTLTINSKLLKEGSLGKNVFSRIPSTCTIIVPKAKLKAYKKLFQAAGLNKKVKIKGR